jgi:hypothetical protein
VTALIALLVAASLAAGCDTAWNWANRGGLRRDVEALFRRHGVAVAGPVCTMVGTSRTGACVLRAPVDALPRLVRGLGLREAGPDDGAVAGWEREGGCRTTVSGATKVYRSGRRPPELRLSTGSAFEYLLVYQEEQSERLCVQVSYAYG